MADVRVALTVIAAAAGTWCLIWGLRSIGSRDWRLVILGWLLYEAACFIWFGGGSWSWLWTWASSN